MPFLCFIFGFFFTFVDCIWKNIELSKAYLIIVKGKNALPTNLVYYWITYMQFECLYNISFLLTSRTVELGRYQGIPFVIIEVPIFSLTSIFASHLHGIPGDLLSHIQSTSETFTFFAPNNDAFAKVPRTIQQRMAQVDQLRSEVSDVLGLHFTSQASVCERYRITRSQIVAFCFQISMTSPRVKYLNIYPASEYVPQLYGWNIADTA